MGRVRGKLGMARTFAEKRLERLSVLMSRMEPCANFSTFPRSIIVQSVLLCNYDKEIDNGVMLREREREWGRETQVPRSPSKIAVIRLDPDMQQHRAECLSEQPTPENAEGP